MTVMCSGCGYYTRILSSTGITRLVCMNVRCSEPPFVAPWELDRLLISCVERGSERHLNGNTIDQIARETSSHPILAQGLVISSGRGI